MFTTDRYELIVRKETITPQQFFDLTDDPQEDRNLVNEGAVVKIRDDMMQTYVRPFFDPPTQT